MKNKVFFAIICATVAISASAATKTQHNVTQSQARVMETEMRMLTTPIIGELDVTGISRVTDSLEFYIGDFKSAEKEIKPYLDDYKQYTIANYCSKYNCDVVLNPLFQISTNADGDRLKVVVTGFPAKYKSFRLSTEADDWMFSIINDSYDAKQRLEKVVNSTAK